MVLLALWVITQDMTHVRSVIQQSGYLGLALAVLVYGALGPTPIPSEPLTLFISATFGPLAAMLVAGLGNLLASLVEYVIGRNIGDATDAVKRKQSLPFGLSKAPLDSPLFLIGARMLPFYAPKLVSLISGAYRVPLRRYIWTSALFSFGTAAILAYGGYGLLNLKL
jgi:uncharacterized membrane protein YdjX (TVP38/TMEM64 family)